MTERNFLHFLIAKYTLMLFLNSGVWSMKFYHIFVLLVIFASSANSSSVSEIEIISDISSKECLEVLENGNMINLIDGIYPVIVYKKHSYFIQTDYMGGNKAYICKSKKKLITN